jgi:hypothetical protein
MSVWTHEVTKPVADDGNAMDIEDGEVALKVSSHKVSNSYVHSIEDKNLLSFYLISIVDVILEGVENWTLDIRRLYLRGLEGFICMTRSLIMPVVPQLLAYLGPPIRDEEVLVRQAAERVCVVMGTYVPYQDLLDILLPKVQGHVSGADTFSHSK